MATRRKSRRTQSHVWKRGNSYYMEFVWKGVRYGPKSLGPVSADVAQRLAAERRLQVIEGRYHPRPVPTFEAFCVEFLEWFEGTHRAGSFERYYATLTRLWHTWGPLPLDAITARLIEQEKSTRLRTCRPNTVNQDLMIVGHVLQTAVTWGVLGTNPARDVERVPSNERRIRVLTPDEERRLIREAPPRLKPLIAFAVATGLRPGELTTLCWRQIAWHPYPTVTVESGTAKNRRFRTIPLGPSAVAALPLRALPDARVFGYRDWQHSFRDAVRRAGIPYATPHAMRHSFASRALEAGINIRRVQQWLGHAKVTQTEVYTHPDPALDYEAILTLERQMSQQADG